MYMYVHHYIIKSHTASVRSRKTVIMILPKSKGGLLVLLWSIVMLIYEPFIITHNTNAIHINYSAITYLILPTYLVLGLVADICLGRYKVIVACIYCAFIGWLCLGISFFVANKYLQPLFGITGFVVGTVGAAGLQFITVPFNIDQLIGASADELSVVIYWHILGYPLGQTLSRLSHCLVTSELHRQIIGLCVSGVAIAIVMVTYYLLRHHLDTTPLLTNPVKLIFKVLNYARKNKYPRNRSALTYWEESAPSRLDLGKDKYGGPFTEEEVEDVKTVFKFCPLLVSIFGVLNITILQPFIHHKIEINQIERCIYESFSDIFSVITLLVALVYKMLFSKWCHRYIPSMLIRIGMSFSILFIASLLNISMDVVNYNSNINCTLTAAMYKPLLTNYVLALSSRLFANIGGLIVIVVSLELTIAQSPVNMRGLMVGLWYGATFASTLLNYIIYISFTQLHSHCTLYYHVTMTVCALLTTIIYCILARRYKLRVRNEVINIHHIVATTYDRYIQQSNEYRQLCNVR